MPSSRSIGEAGEVLARARRGDDSAFRALIEPHRAALHAHCYRMLGSLHDAEDALQETLLRAWRGLPRFTARSSLRTWLHRVATNVCLDAIARRPRRVLPVDYGPAAPAGTEPGPPLPEATWIGPYPDAAVGLEDGYASPESAYEQREAVELAFVAALQRLAPRQRAVLILREVLGFSAQEVAESLDTTITAVNSSLQRARKTIEAHLPERSQQATLRALGDRELRELVRRFTDAFERGDADAIRGLLTDDVTFAMPPYREWYRGKEQVADSWLMPGPAPTGLRYVFTRASGQLALGTYSFEAGRARFAPIALDVLALHDGLVREVYAFRNVEIFPAFGLPRELAADLAPAGRPGDERA